MPMENCIVIVFMAEARRSDWCKRGGMQADAIDKRECVAGLVESFCFGGDQVVFNGSRCEGTNASSYSLRCENQSIYDLQSHHDGPPYSSWPSIRAKSIPDKDGKLQSHPT